MATPSLAEGKQSQEIEWDGLSAPEAGGDAVDPSKTTTEAENKFQRAISAWRNINLTQLVPDLDSTASDIVANQRDALVERKELAQKTKDFRKLDDSAKLTEVKGLLKAYQTYIDLLSNQSKTVQSSFLQLYASLSEAPDPYPLLEASVDSLVVADETVPKLEAENQHLQSSNTKLTSQLEDTERRLDQERKARQELEETRDLQIKEVETSWSAVLAEKQDNWEAREKNLEERAESQERLLKELKASYEVSQRLDRGEGGDEGAAHATASAAELEIVSADLERANLRLADVESRNEQLRVELAQSASQMPTGSKTRSIEEDPAFLRLRSENSSLLRKMDSARFEKESERRELETNVRTLRKEVSALKQDSDSLRAKVSKWGDYEDMKRELEVLKQIEFSTGDNDELGDLEQIDGNSKAAKDGQNLEQLLLARNKKLNNELTVLRVSHQDLASRLETLQEDLSNTNMELEKSRSLTATLENDLAKVQHEAQTPQPALSVAGFSSRHPQSSYGRRGGRASPTSSIISGFDGSPNPSNTLDALRAGEPVGGGSGILPMITAQRDRFKKRNAELEGEISKTYQTVSSLRSEIASLQKDNLNLYEKTRYVSTYSRGQPATTSSSSSYATNPNPSSIQISDPGSPINKYQAQYESRISPFAAFRGRESARAFKRMTLPERIVYQVTRLVLATRTSRNLFALYCFCLHLLIFGMLYYTTTIEVEKGTTHLADSTVAAVVGAAGVGAGANADEGDHWQQEGFQEATQ